MVPADEFLFQDNCPTDEDVIIIKIDPTNIWMIWQPSWSFFVVFFYAHYLSRLLLLSFAIKNNAETLLLVGPRPRLMDHKDDVATAEWGDHWIAWQKVEEKLFRVLGSLSLLKDPRSTSCYLTLDLSIFYGRQIDH